VKDPLIGVEVAIIGKITGHFSPTVPPFDAWGLSRRCGRGGAWYCKWEPIKHRVVQEAYRLRYIRGVSRRGPIEEEEEEEEGGGGGGGGGGRSSNNNNNRFMSRKILCIHSRYQSPNV
jgi:hypothetical protein